MKTETPWKVRTICQALREDYEKNKINIRTVRERLYKAGIYNYLPDEKQALNYIYSEPLLFTVR